ncbi:Ferredoxin subunit of nitrite reductase or a ring-hydroxylating dioxygenase [Tenacibaculum sp. MAR_2009_124]|uniref:Rieske 2Fe-2S domain-containing protein n=1 Tax=Tenacibaculum sp. MAR_2009_124 TaxID=1250059 RepID=UPI00089928B4|nr:Rieske 2Fe-2S domain-containing protein [Tenacibaculum sp. MAR_2009_124]SEB45436.1 Ferredoxin subunit of nitrite reductase or a ring-hydroxylating dioxygenase [Tenacibaculum sp. MAR_2009_124]
MGLDYKLVIWNKYKKQYDIIIAVSMFVYLFAFALVTITYNSETSIETLVIRAFGSLAIIMLHVILVIGPLSRLNTNFLPILYNRRHLGVSMFIAALIHGGFGIFQFHALGNTNPIYSLFISNVEYNSLVNFPFQVLGFLALIILFIMASTSHDFFLANLSAKVWKRLHMMVYIAYALLIGHVFLGAFQQEASLFTVGFMVLGFIGIASLHLITAFKERKIDHSKYIENSQWLKVCHIDEIEETKAKIFTTKKERVAIFKHNGELSAIHNVCKHQGGPLGEGKIIDGCITSPWHGYQYLPQNGQSPPPFNEKVATYQLKLENSFVFINPQAFPEGSEIEPLSIEL